MSKMLNEEEFKNRIAKNIILIENYTGGRNRIKVRCSVCGHEWSPYARKLLEGNNCPNCSKISQTKTHKQFLIDLEQVTQTIVPLEKYVNSHTKILCNCKKCGHEWKASPNKLLHGKGCPKCAGNAKRTFEEIKIILAEKI